MCAACFRYLIGEKPACAACAFVEGTRSQRRASLALAFVLVTAGIGFALVRAEILDVASAVVAGVAAAILAGVVWTATRPRVQAEVRAIDEEDAAEVAEPLAPAAHPYRARIRRDALVAAPPVSGTATVLVVLASLVFCGVAFPAALRLPLWLELEIGIGAAWVLLTAVLAWNLHRGFRLRDDYVFVPPWKGAGGGGSWSSGCGDGCGGVSDGEGLIILLVLVVALFGAVLLVELLVPAVFVLVYVVILKALKTVAKDSHACRGNLLRSIAWGAGWALIFLVPPAAVVWVAQLVR